MNIINAWAFRKNFGVSGAEFLRYEVRLPRNEPYMFIDHFLQEIESKGDFIKIPDDKVTDYTKKLIT